MEKWSTSSSHIKYNLLLLHIFEWINAWWLIAPLLWLDLKRWNELSPSSGQNYTFLPPLHSFHLNQNPATASPLQSRLCHGRPKRGVLSLPSLTVCFPSPNSFSQTQVCKPGLDRMNIVKGRGVWEEKQQSNCALFSPAVVSSVVSEVPTLVCKERPWLDFEGTRLGRGGENTYLYLSEHGKSSEVLQFMVGH